MNDNHFFEFDYEYNKQSLQDLYDEYIHEFPAERNMRSPFRALSDNLDLTSHETVAKMYELMMPIPKRSHFFTVCQLARSVRPHINPRNNGTIFFPISGSFSIDFYNFETPVDFDGRPTFSPMPEERPELSPEQEQALQDSKFMTLEVTKPVAVNGLKLHGYQPTSLEPPVIAVFKIPLETSWETIIQAINSPQQ